MFGLCFFEDFFDFYFAKALKQSIFARTNGKGKPNAVISSNKYCRLQSNNFSFASALERWVSG